MIVVQLMGGLGNQMFQYAAGRRLSHVRHLPLKLDISWFKGKQDRRYSLSSFNTQENFATDADLAKFRELEFRPSIQRIVLALKNSCPLFSSLKVKERYVWENPALLMTKGDLYLEGYWQNEQYFKDIKDIIHHEFTFKNTPERKNAVLSEQISNCESVSVHIRRGDYVSNPVTLQFHGILPLEYYQKSLARIMESVENSHFYVFSDDPIWPRDNLRIQDPVTYITHNGPDKDYEDLRLMSLCKHHIIANSSFSWWAAWLCQNPEKMVIGPTQWFLDPVLNAQTADMIPPEWIRI
jgi:hypothetical protein